ncbi:MAG: hypothetical protein F4X11_15360 [Acidobacteria bacterium]|nr:hypothetical protein [Acidobacteriota bacterium]
MPAGDPCTGARSPAPGAGVRGTTRCPFLRCVSRWSAAAVCWRHGWRPGRWRRARTSRLRRLRRARLWRRRRRNRLPGRRRI